MTQPAELPTKADRLAQAAEDIHSSVQGVDYYAVNDILDWPPAKAILQTVADTVSESDRWLARVRDQLAKSLKRNANAISKSPAKAALAGFGAGCAVGYIVRRPRKG